MTSNQEQKVKELLSKYNEILLVSMRLAISEDFINLMILNRDDSEFELSDLMANKEEFSNYIMREFLKKNSSSVVNDLRMMEEPLIEMKKRFAQARR